MSSSSIDQPTSHTGESDSSNTGIVAALIITVVACGLHGLAGRSGLTADSAWFAIVGIGFLAVTVAAHLAVSRAATAAADPFGAVSSLLLSMAIRLSGTFIILGLLLWASPLERAEAVFNVLFWYITLTVTDVVSLVRARRRMEA